MAIHKARKGDKRRAMELPKGSERATGQALLGSGLLKDVPVFHELATAGKVLGVLWLLTHTGSQFLLNSWCIKQPRMRVDSSVVAEVSKGGKTVCLLPYIT